MVECFDEENGFCVLDPACRLKGVLARAMKAYFEVLDSVMLEDILTDRSQFEVLLRNPSNPIWFRGSSDSGFGPGLVQ